MSWDGSFVPFGNRSIGIAEQIADQVVNFKLDYSMTPILLEIVSKWIGKKVIVTVEGCLKLEGKLDRVDKDYISIILSEPAAGGKEKEKEYKIEIDRVEFIECCCKPKLPKNFII